MLSQQLTQTCIVTRPPATGETASSTVAASLACTFPFPASKVTRERPDMATKVNIFEMFTAEADIEHDDKVEVNGRFFDILVSQKWQSAFNGGQTFVMLIMEEPID